MLKKKWAAGLIVAVACATAMPALAQSIQIGPDGIRVVPQEQQQPVRGDRRDRSDQRGERGQRGEPSQRGGIGEREAVQAARSEGMHEVDTVSRSERAYRVVGVDRRGDGLQVDVDRRNGRVLSVR